MRDDYKVANVGLATGLIRGSHTFAAAFTAPIMGWWSDRNGRKNLLIMGMAIAMVCAIVSGLVESYWVSLSISQLSSRRG